MSLATITINMDPALRVGPVDIAWHGLMTAIGVLLAALVAHRYGGRRGLSRDDLTSVLMTSVISGIVGSRILYLIEHGQFAPSDWLGTRGFSIYGGMIGGALGGAAYMWRHKLSALYLDAIAVGFPLGLAVGRIGDLISGEHYGGETSVAWGVRYLNENAEVPRLGVAYQSGALYEILLGLIMLALVVAVRRRLERPLELLWLVIASYGAGRFVMFFFRADSESAPLGLSVSQWISLALVAVAAAGWLWSRHRWPAGRRLILTTR